MKAELIINNVRLDLGHKELNRISYSLEDCKRNKDVFHELAQSTSTEMRSYIGSLKNLHRKTVRLLLADSQIEVIRSLTDNNKFISRMSIEDIERFISFGDTEILTAIVANISDLTDGYEVCEKDWLCEKLYQQPDPTIRLELSSTTETPEFILKKLIKDSDIDVSRAAQDTLDEINEENFDDDDDEF